jgi:hypothetical protein
VRVRLSVFGGGVIWKAYRKTCSQPLPHLDEKRLMTERLLSGMRGVHASTQHAGTKQGQSADGDEHGKGGIQIHTAVSELRLIKFTVKAS